MKYLHFGLIFVYYNFFFSHSIFSRKTKFILDSYWVKYFNFFLNRDTIYIPYLKNLANIKVKFKEKGVPRKLIKKVLARSITEIY